MIKKIPNLGEDAIQITNAEFIEICSDIIELVNQCFPFDVDSDEEFDKWLLLNFLKFSLETSQSLILLATSNLIRQGYMLTRVRLEQAIISSYLVHSDRNDGILPYFLQSGINLHKTYSITNSNEEMGQVLNRILKKFDIDTSGLHDLADLSQVEKNKLRDSVSDKYDREWTKLDLRSLALKRDQLLESENYILANSKMVNYYDALYKSGSYLLHSDAVFIVSSFDETLKEMNQATLLSNNCAFDLIQVEEVSNFLEIDVNNSLKPLVNKYVQSAAKNILGHII